MLERMLNTVPRNVKLTDVINPIDVKPRNLLITPNDDGTLFVNGYIRVCMESFTYDRRKKKRCLEKTDSLR